MSFFDIKFIRKLNSKTEEEDFSTEEEAEEEDIIEAVDIIEVDILYVSTINLLDLMNFNVKNVEKAQSLKNIFIYFLKSAKI